MLRLTQHEALEEKVDPTHNNHLRDHHDHLCLHSRHHAVHSSGVSQRVRWRSRRLFAAVLEISARLERVGEVLGDGVVVIRGYR